MTELGRMRPTPPELQARFVGQLHTMQQTYSIRLEGDELLCDSRSPSHRVYARNRMGDDVQIGSAWLKTAKHGPRAGERFLTFSIDFPELPSALNVAAFRDPAQGDWVITWRRRGVRELDDAAA